METVELVDREPTKTTRIGTTLSNRMKRRLVQFLKGNLDAFALSHKDMLGIATEVIQHCLNVDPEKKLVQQRQRVFAPKQNKAIMDEVKKLLVADFIHEVYCPNWLANVILVKKANRKWKMCIDFTNLNKPA